ncbi:hypothetical protein SB861_44555, partial [Paraburkholderia sp. SIMBA_049]
AFFCLLFFAAAKKSRCRPAQGRRVNVKHHNADASANPSKPNRPSHEDNTRMRAPPHADHKKRRRQQQTQQP